MDTGISHLDRNFNWHIDSQPIKCVSISILDETFNLLENIDMVHKDEAVRPAFENKFVSFCIYLVKRFAKLEGLGECSEELQENKFLSLFKPIYNKASQASKNIIKNYVIAQIQLIDGILKTEDNEEDKRLMKALYTAINIPSEGGKSKNVSQYVTYNHRRYRVHKQNKKKCIKVKGEYVALSTIKGKYKACK